MRALVLGGLALALTGIGASPAEAHVVFFKTCLVERIESVSSPMLRFERRPEARRSATYSWNSLASDKFGGQYADFTMSHETRALCSEVDAGGFACVFTGFPCREVEDCATVGNKPCYEEER